MDEHAERVTITDALEWGCVEGDCDHYDELDDFDTDFAKCPRITIEVCVDCMDEREFGRDPRWWEELVSHTDPPQPDPIPEPAIFKPAADVEIRGHQIDRLKT